MRLTLADAAAYLKTRQLPPGMRQLLRNFEHIFGYGEERENRLRRYIAIVRAYQGGAPVEWIADKFGCSRSTLHRYISMSGVGLRPRGFSAEIREAVIRDYKDDIPISQIARLHNVSQAYVSRTAGVEGISRYAAEGRNSGRGTAGNKTRRRAP